MIRECPKERIRLGERRLRPHPGAFGSLSALLIRRRQYLREWPSVPLDAVVQLLPEQIGSLAEDVALAAEGTRERAQRRQPVVARAAVPATISAILPFLPSATSARISRGPDPAQGT